MNCSRDADHFDVQSFTFSEPEIVVRAVRNNFYKKSVTVVGDIMLDRYIEGSVERISPEAPVPVIKITKETYCGGGAANVALNLAGLGLVVSVCGVVGADREGARVTRMLSDAGIAVDGVIKLDERVTTTKTRVISNRQQITRLDREETSALSEQAAAVLVGVVVQQIESKPSVVVLSDYAKGVLSPNACQELTRSATRHGVPVLVDPKSPDFTKYTGATALVPNRTELAAASQVEPADLEELMAVGERMRSELGLDYLVTTLGDEGMVLIDEGGRRRVAAMPREVFNVSGAGDTAIATLAAAHAAELDVLDAVRLANLAAGVVVGKAGTSPIDKDVLLSAMKNTTRSAPHEKIFSLAGLQLQLQEWRDSHRKIVFTNGCFDLLHAGHVKLLTEAKSLGDWLIVGLNTDRSVRKLKGSGRPVVSDEDRARVLAGLGSVDAVILFDEDTPISLITDIRPDVLAKGADYASERIVGDAEVRSWGGRVVLIPHDNGKSSTRIIEDIKRPGALSEGVR